LRFILLERLGSAIVVNDVTEQELSRIIAYSSPFQPRFRARCLS